MPIRRVLKKALLWVLDTEDPKPTDGHRPTALKRNLHHLPMQEPHNPPSHKNQSEGMNPRLKGKTGLVLKALLLIHESIEDSDAMQGYEGLPLQVEQIYWQVWGVLSRHTDLDDPSELMDIWMDECVTPDDLKWED